MKPVSILFAAAFEGAAAVSAGLLLLEMLGIRLYRGEVWPVALALGSACLSLLVFLLLCVWLAKTWVFAIAGAALIGLCLWRKPWLSIRKPGPEPENISPAFRWLMRLCLAAFGLYSFIYALAPETSPDGVAYHLGMVGRYFRAGGFEWYTGNMYANLPMGMEMLYLFAYAFGRHSATALTHWQFLMAMPFLLLATGRRFGHPVAGATAGLLVFLSPVVMLDGSTSYVDTAAAFIAAALFFALLAWEQEHRSRGWLIAVGILAGFSYGCKMTAAPAVVFAFVFVAWVLWRRREWSWRQMLLLAGCSALFFAPWMIKNAMMVGNPFSPFLNRYFPNPNVRISFEEMYRQAHRDYYGTVKSWREIPREVLIEGGKLNGLLGPVFLLAPLGLLGLRYRLGRRALLFWAFLVLTYPGNIGTRFLIGGLPMASLGMGLALESWSAIPMLLLAFHAFLSWPTIIPAYSDPYSWRMDRFRWAQAWRKEPEMDFLARTVQGYTMAREIERRTPRDARIFTFNGVAEAYTTRDIAVAYQSGFNNMASDFFVAGVAADMITSVSEEFRFPALNVRKVRLVQTATTPQIWSVGELRALSPQGSAYERQQWWKIRATPSPWEVQFAFDNCPVTRWKAWEASRPGEFIEIDFIRPVELGGLRAELSDDQPDVRMRVDVDTGDGVWRPVSATPARTRLEFPRNARRMAAEDLRRLGFTHLSVANGEFIADDVFRNEAAWGLTLLANTGDGRLYSLDSQQSKR